MGTGWGRGSCSQMLGGLGVGMSRGEDRMTFLEPVWRVCVSSSPRLSGHPSIYLHLPEHHPLVPATRCQLLGVWTEADCFHTPLVTYKVAQDTARSGREPRPGCLARSPAQPPHPLRSADTWLLLRPTGGWCSHRRCWQRGGHWGRSGRTSQGLGRVALVRERQYPPPPPPPPHLWPSTLTLTDFSSLIAYLSCPHSLLAYTTHLEFLDSTQSVPIKCRHLPETLTAQHRFTASFELPSPQIFLL